MKLRWNVQGVLSDGVVGTDIGGNAYRMDKDYRPVEAWARVKTATQGVGDTGIRIDINTDGESIFTETLGIPDDVLTATSKAFTGASLNKGAVVTLDVDEVGAEYAGNDLVVELEVKED